jgi:ketosteroid isomerase-like protein
MRLLLLICALAGYDSVWAQAPVQDFASFLTQVEAAQVLFAEGQPQTFKALWSHGNDVTLIGGLGGGIEKGWDRVSARLDWASSNYTQGKRRHREVARFVGPNTAYVVQLETIVFRAPGAASETTQELRATMIFRLEGGVWKIVHRHADTQTAKAGSGPALH